MSNFSIFLVVLAIIALVVNGAIEEHKMTTLPGLINFIPLYLIIFQLLIYFLILGFTGPLPSTHYSGLLPVGKLSGVAGHLHYWFIESTSTTPTTDPVVLWLNGGPGSSSLIGLLTENGQLITSDESLENKINGIPQLFVNPTAWSTMANMIYLESPKGVGFSYCDNVKTSKECVNSDESTAQDAYEFLVNFFTAYPEYKNNKFYITGESYAGNYIPMMIDQLDKDVLNAQIHVVGAAIGNGCTGNTVGTCAFGTAQSAQIKAEFM